MLLKDFFGGERVLLPVSSAWSAYFWMTMFSLSCRSAAEAGWSPAVLSAACRASIGTLETPTRDVEVADHNHSQERLAVERSLKRDRSTAPKDPCDKRFCRPASVLSIAGTESNLALRHSPVLEAYTPWTPAPPFVGPEAAVQLSSIHSLPGDALFALFT
jgi:hypothetical protein